MHHFLDDEGTHVAMSLRIGSFSGQPKEDKRLSAKHRFVDLDLGDKHISTSKLSTWFRF